MDPVSTCDSVISIIKKSGLNFKIEETPFSVSISIRKTFIKMNAASAGSFDHTRANSNIKRDFSRSESGGRNLVKSSHSCKQSNIFVAPTPTAKPSSSMLNSLSNPNKSSSYIPNHTPPYIDTHNPQTSNPTKASSCTSNAAMPHQPTWYTSSLDNFTRLAVTSSEPQICGAATPITSFPFPRAPPGFPFPSPRKSNSFPVPRLPCHPSVPPPSPTSSRPHSPPSPRTPPGLPPPRATAVSPITQRESPTARLLPSSTSSTDPGPPTTAWHLFPFRQHPMNSESDEDDSDEDDSDTTEPEDFEELLKKLKIKYDIN